MCVFPTGLKITMSMSTSIIKKNNKKNTRKQICNKKKKVKTLDNRKN